MLAAFWWRCRTLSFYCTMPAWMLPMFLPWCDNGISELVSQPQLNVVFVRWVLGHGVFAQQWKSGATIKPIALYANIHFNKYKCNFSSSSVFQWCILLGSVLHALILALLPQTLPLILVWGSCMWGEGSAPATSTALASLIPWSLLP